jgi:GNAT superfamily N-acetyltransferase
MRSDRGCWRSSADLSRVRCERHAFENSFHTIGSVIRCPRHRAAHGPARIRIVAADAATKLARILSRSDHQFLIADAEGRAVGWLHAAITEYIEADPFVVVGGLVVDGNHRGQGIGRMLLEHAEEWARKQGCSIVRVWSSTARTAAHRFYEHLGYRNVKTQHSFVKPVNDAGFDEIKRFVPRVDQ